MNEPDFTDREKYLLHFYRDAKHSGRLRGWWDELGYLVPSLFCAVMFVLRGSVEYAALAYGIMLWRFVHSQFTGSGYTNDLRNIFAKYDAKVRELSDELEKHSKKFWSRLRYGSIWQSLNFSRRRCGRGSDRGWLHAPERGHGSALFCGSHFIGAFSEQLLSRNARAAAAL